MATRLIICTHCLTLDSHLQRTVNQLQTELADRLEVVMLDCMAACDTAPAAMVDNEYLPFVSAEELEQAIRERVAPVNVE